MIIFNKFFLIYFFNMTYSRHIRFDIIKLTEHIKNENLV